MTSSENKTSLLLRASQSLQHPKVGPWLLNEAKKTPDDLRIWWLLAQAYGLKRPLHAAKALSRVLQLAPPEVTTLQQAIQQLQALHETPDLPVSPLLQLLFETNCVPEWLWQPPYTLPSPKTAIQVPVANDTQKHLPIVNSQPPAATDTQEHIPAVSAAQSMPTQQISPPQQAETEQNGHDVLPVATITDTQEHALVRQQPTKRPASGSVGILAMGKRIVTAFSSAAFGLAGVVLWIVTVEIIILYVIDVLGLLNFSNLFDSVLGVILGILGILPIAISAINIYINMGLVALAIGAAAGAIALTLGTVLSRIHKPTAYGITVLAGLGGSVHLYSQLIPYGSEWITEYDYIGGWEFHRVVFVLAGLVISAMALAIVLDDEAIRESDESEELPGWMSAPFKIAGKGVGLSFNVWAAGAETAAAKSDKTYEFKTDPKYDSYMAKMGRGKMRPRDYRDLAKWHRTQGGANNRKSAKFYDDIADSLEGRVRLK